MLSFEHIFGLNTVEEKNKKEVTNPMNAEQKFWITIWAIMAFAIISIVWGSLLYSGYMNKLRFENGYEQKIVESHGTPTHSTIWCLRNKDEDGNTVTPIEEIK